MTEEGVRPDLRALLGHRVEVTIDRPLGSRHPHHPDIVYPVNYGYLLNTVSEDGARFSPLRLRPRSPSRSSSSSRGSGFGFTAPTSLGTEATTDVLLSPVSTGCGTVTFNQLIKQSGGGRD